MLASIFFLNDLNFDKYFFIFIFYFFNLKTAFYVSFVKNFNGIRLNNLKNKKPKLLLKKKKTKKTAPSSFFSLKSLFFIKNVKNNCNITNTFNLTTLNSVLNFKFNLFFKRQSGVRFVSTSFFKNYYKFFLSDAQISPKNLKKKKFNVENLNEYLFLWKKKKFLNFISLKN